MADVGSTPTRPNAHSPDRHVYAWKAQLGDQMNLIGDPMGRADGFDGASSLRGSFLWSEVVGVEFVQGVEETVGGRETVVVVAGEGGEHQSRTAEGLKHSKALLESDLTQAMGGGQDAEEHDADECDLAEGAAQRSRVNQTTLRRSEELAVQRRGLADVGGIGGKH